MYAIDCCVPCLAHVPHRISGEIWFQLISSWLLALPSIGICAYALIQTKKYHDLDEERLRPELLMDSAAISMCMLNWKGFAQWAHSKDDIDVPQQEEYQRYRQKHSWTRKDGSGSIRSEDDDNLGYLELEADLILRGGESVSQIIIQEIIVIIGNHWYLLKVADETGSHFFFDRSYKNGQEEYHIMWQLDYEDIVFEDKGRGSCAKPEESSEQEPADQSECIQRNFWEDMYNAVADPEYDISRRDMEWQIFMSVEYGLNRTRNGKKEAGAEWRIRWNGQHREFVNDYTARQCSREGIISVV